MATMLVIFLNLGSTRTMLLRSTVKESNSVVPGTSAVRKRRKLETMRTQKESALLMRFRTRLVFGKPWNMGS
jgi:hypothetical protein